MAVVWCSDCFAKFSLLRQVFQFPSFLRKSTQNLWKCSTKNMVFSGFVTIFNEKSIKNQWKIKENLFNSKNSTFRFFSQYKLSKTSVFYHFLKEKTKKECARTIIGKSSEFSRLIEIGQWAVCLSAKPSIFLNKSYDEYRWINVDLFKRHLAMDDGQINVMCASTLNTPIYNGRRCERWAGGRTNR